MSSKELENIAQQWFDAFNQHNLKMLLDLYDDYAIHFSPKLKVRHPETKGLISGKTALRSWWQDAFERLPSLRYEVTRLTPHDDRVFMEYIRHVDQEESFLVGELLEVREGKIIKSTVFHT